ncbi:MAG: glycosyltransferase family 39 protein [Myxococcales bacterium]|nr:glycosyltransferase family 39 protein [Myxococcales bacterium]MBK7193806.1 glycosyltransferase family 39 protein [Myxococcales bacterium]
MSWRQAVVPRALPWLIALVAIAAVLIARAALVPAPLERLAVAPSQPGDPPGTRAYVGALHVPRGGPTRVGFVSPGPAVLTVEGLALPVIGRGVRTERVVLSRGAVAIRFAAPPGARLVWHPAGRTGDPEYVPASSLSPRPPREARFDHPGTARGDALAAWLVLLIVIATALWSWRAALRALPRDALLVMAAVFAVAAIARLWDLGAAGQTWDEDTYWSAGRNYVQNLVRGDFDDAAWRWNYEHPPVTKYLAGLGGLWGDGFGGARAMSALAMALGCALLVPIGRRLVDLRVGALAGGIAALAPHLIGHGQVVGHEAPSVAAWALAWWLSARVWDDGDRVRPLAWRLVAVGVVLGVALMIRFVNGLMAPAIGLTILITAPAGARVRAVTLGLAIIPAVAIVTAIALWPRLWTHPIAHTQEAWDKLKGTHSLEPFHGTLTKAPPRWYFVSYLGATTPIVVLVAAAAGLALAVARAWRGALIIIVWAIAPLGVMLSPVRQDGIRYVLPVLLPMALAAAIGVAAVARWIGERLHVLAGLAVSAALGIYLVVTCARIHPYYLDYYGEQTGGPAAVAEARRYEIAWWGEGVERAIGYVNAHAAAGDRVHRDCVEPGHLTWFRGDLWEPVRDPRQAQWIVHYQPSWRPCPIPPDATRVLRVEAQGAPLVDVYQRGRP